MNGRFVRNTALFSVVCLLIVSSSGVSGPVPNLPDGASFPDWADRTDYSKKYYVDKNHPEASDENPGTREEPFRTINQAAEVVRPGEKVVVKEGVYREKIVPKRGGTSPEQMICYQAAEGENVIVRGSRVLETGWERSIDAHGERYSKKLWQTKLPSSLFEGREHPFQIPNASEKEMELMPWAERWTGRVPFTLPRGLVFQDGKRLVQLARYEDLARVPGSYWVDTEENELHVHPIGSYNPGDSTFEVTVQQHLLKPDRVGTGYIKVKGFTFERVANGFPRIGVGAVYVNGGHHWIIEENVVRQANSVGIEAGARISEAAVSSEEEEQRVADHPGGFIIRNNTVYECGTGGIQGHTVRNTFVAGNHIHHVGWQGVEQYWECAGVKLLINRNTVVARNHIHHIASAGGIWLDWGNENSRVTQNLIHTIRPNYNGAIFVEASRKPNLVDNNVLWNVQTKGIYLGDTDRTTVAHNLVGQSRTPVVVREITDRTLNGKPLTSKRNVIRNNLFYNNQQLPDLEDENNTCDHNLYVDDGGTLPFEEWFNTWGENSRKEDMRIQFDSGSLELTVETQSVPRVSIMKQVGRDLFGNSRDGDQTPAGPFSRMKPGTETFPLGDVFRSQ